MRKSIFVLLVLLAIGLSPIDAQNERVWTPARLLGDGWWQSLTLDQQNNLHIVWYGGLSTDNQSHDVLFYVEKRNDGTWSTPIDAIYTGDGGYTIRNNIASTSDGMLHIAYRGGVQHYVSNAPIVGALNPQNWSSGNQVGPSGYYLDLLAGSDDTLHLVLSNLQYVPDAKVNARVDRYAEGAKCFLCYDLFYRRSIDGGKTWSDSVPISLEPASGSDRPKIKQGFSGRLYISWDEGKDWYTGGGDPEDVRLVYSDDQGLTWSKPIIFKGGSPDTKPIQLSFTELRDGSWMVVWRPSNASDRSIYYQLSSDIGKTWTDPKPIPGIVARSANSTTLDRYELLTDHLGIVHLFAIGDTDIKSITNEKLYDITYVPSSNYWVEPQRIYFNTDSRPEWPEAVIGPSNDIHLVWFDRKVIPGSDCNTCDLKVYYSYLPGNMGAEPTRAFKPTSTPLPTATVFVNYVPTPTPLPTLQGVEPTVAVTTVDNYAAQTFLSGMFISALFCGGVVLLLRWRR
jgi:hypothetical protein